MRKNGKTFQGGSHRAARGAGSEEKGETRKKEERGVKRMEIMTEAHEHLTELTESIREEYKGTICAFRERRRRRESDVRRKRLSENLIQPYLTYNFII